ncbi:MAG: hypothetical protein V2A34_12540 [Lentisphaerota bacterium]
MKSSATPDFWKTLSCLPPGIKLRAKTVYRLWQQNPQHPSLHLKKVGDVWSIRIGSGYRALAILREDTFYWFWIGTHDEYERLLALC